MYFVVAENLKFILQREKTFFYLYRLRASKFFLNLSKIATNHLEMPTTFKKKKLARELIYYINRSMVFISYDINFFKMNEAALRIRFNK